MPMAGPFFIGPCIGGINIEIESRNLRAAECRPYGKMAFVGAAFCRPCLPFNHQPVIAG